MTYSKSIFDQSTAQLSDSLDKIMDIPDSKTLNSDEQKNILSNVAAFTHTLSKASKSGLIAPELKDISRNFEKANFDISRMPREYAQSLKRTYEDLTEVVKQDPGYFKNSASKAYCDTYELFNGTKFKNFVTKIKNSKGVKKVINSNEDYKNLDSIESLDAYVSELCRDSNVQSEEFLGKGLVNKMLTPVSTELTGFTSSVSMLSSVLIIAVVVISILIICMCILSAMYQQRVVEAIEAICDNKTNSSYPKKINKVAVAKSMEDNIPKATNTFLVKPMIMSTKYVNKITDPKYAKNLDKGLATLDEASENVSKESLDRSEEGLPVAVVAFKAFITTHPVFIVSAIIIALILIIPLLRGLIYWCSRFRFRVGLLLKEQNETINNNIEVLIEKYNNPLTSPDEKARLDRIISRQQNIAGKLSKLSNLFYKEQLTANSDTASNLRDDDKINFDKIVEDNEASINDVESTVVVNPSKEPSTGNASIIF